MKIQFLILIIFLSNFAFSENIDLFIVAGQSNAQGWKGDGKYYPQGSKGIDKKIPLYWLTPGKSKKYPSSDKWITLQAQKGRFPAGHFGLEISFARLLKQNAFNPAIFKCSQGSTSLAGNWGKPGSGKMYDIMVKEINQAVTQLNQQGHKVKFQAFIWIQGESDGRNASLANAYKKNLEILIKDLRNNVTKEKELPIILGVDEQHKWMKQHPQVVKAQQELAKADKNIIFTSMIGLEKADSTHLTPKGLQEHGKRIYDAYMAEFKKK